MKLDKSNALVSTHKRCLLVFAFYLICLAMSYLLYISFAYSLIEAIYNGRSIDILNNLIQFQHKYTLEHYMKIGDLLFGHLVYLSFVFLTYFSLLYFVLKRLIFSEKKLNFIFVLLLCLFTQRLPFILNPQWQIYYTHGFFRGSLSYQMINSGIPPRNPLFSGEMFNAPWAIPWLAAQVSKMLNITPMHATSLINAIATCLVAFLVYKVSGQLFKNKKANICSVLFAIFGTTIFNANLLTWIESFFYSTMLEWRATPFFPKFLYASGDPVGLAFFLLYIYSFIQILKNKHIKSFIVIHFFAILGCGFFYAAMLPAIGASTILFCIAFPFFAKKGIFQLSIRQPLILLGTMALSYALIMPYLLAVSSGVSSETYFFKFEYIYRSIVSYIIPLTPVFFLIYFSRKFWSRVADTQALAFISIVVLANTGVFFFLHIPGHTEYKFMLLATISIGIVGGLGFYGIQKRLPKIVALAILLLFLWPSANQVYKKSRRISNNPLTNVIKKKPLYERGRYLYSSDPQENEMYEWVKQNTGVDQVFVDSTMRLPILAQRRLLIGSSIDTMEKGYNLTMDMIKDINGIDAEEYSERLKIFQNIYGINDSLEPSFVIEYLRENIILVVARHESLDNEFDSTGFQEIFRSCQGNFCVYQVP